jgi:flagellar biosynthesis protein FlhA
VADELFADDRVVIELGRGLVGLVAPVADGAGSLEERAAAVRSSIAAELGFVVPPIAMRDDLRLPDRGYRVSVAGAPVIEGEVPAGRLLAVPPPGEVFDDEDDGSALPAVDPLGGRRGVWLSHARSDTARRRGAAIYGEVECIARGIEAAVRRHADRLLSRDAVARLIESLRASQPAVVEHVVPGVLSLAKIHRTLQALLKDGVPIRPLAELLEIMADHAEEAADPAALAETVRRSLAPAICRRARDAKGSLVVVRLEGQAVDTITAGGRLSTALLGELRRAMRPVVERGGRPVIVVPAVARPAVRDALARHLPETIVLAVEEIADEERVEVFASVGAEAARAA